MGVQDLPRPAPGNFWLKRVCRIVGAALLLWFFISRGQVAVSLGDPSHVSSMAKDPISFFLKPEEDAFGHISTGNEHKATLVVASLKSSNVTWLKKLPKYNQKVYVVDDWHAEHKVPLNKANEAMVFLTYIIDHYHELPLVSVFLHAERFQWHNDDPDYDNLRILQRLRPSRVLQQGYVNLRCTGLTGCDGGFFVLQAQKDMEEKLKVDPHYEPNYVELFPKAWEQLMPGRAVPEQIQAPCCAQFAVSRDAIHSRSKDDYLRYREWILRTELNNHVSGSIFERLWHILFGKDATECPNAETCYCETYGMCNLHCKNSLDCGVYKEPPFYHNHFPEGWPSIGFDGTPRQAQTDAGATDWR